MGIERKYCGRKFQVFLIYLIHHIAKLYKHLIGEKYFVQLLLYNCIFQIVEDDTGNL